MLEHELEMGVGVVISSRLGGKVPKEEGKVAEVMTDSYYNTTEGPRDLPTDCTL